MESPLLYGCHELRLPQRRVANAASRCSAQAPWEKEAVTSGNLLPTAASNVPKPEPAEKKFRQVRKFHPMAGRKQIFPPCTGDG